MEPRIVRCCGFDITEPAPNPPGGMIFTRYSNSDDVTLVENLWAKMPLLVPLEDPFDDSNVYLSNGWFRDPQTPGGDLVGHGGFDYESRDDSVPSFPVHAVADGTIVAVGFDGNMLGNYVVIEHAAPDGTRYRSVYAHLRNGGTDDCNAARTYVGTITTPLPTAPIVDPNDREGRYRLFMANETCAAGDVDAVVWGDDSAASKLHPDIVVGRQIAAGALIGPSGNTGAGGIGFGLDGNGAAVHPRKNIHLHLNFAVHAPASVPQGPSDPTDPTSVDWGVDRQGNPTQWVNIDPYGSYGTVGNGCYALGAKGAYNRLFAPFLPDFHGVTDHDFGQYFDHYPQMGYAMQTASVYEADGELLVAGSFQPGLSGVWKAAVGVTQSEMEDAIVDYEALGLQMREIQVTPRANGDLLFSGLWTEQTATSSDAFLIANDDVFGPIWTNTIASGGRFADHFSYFQGATRIHAGIRVFDGGQNNVPWGYGLSDFNTFDATSQAAGLRPTSVSAEPPGATTYGGVWVPAVGDWLVDADITGGEDGYQALYDQRRAEGRRLYRVQGHSDGDRFSAIWSRNEQRPQASFVITGATGCQGPGGATVTLDSSATTFDGAFVIGYQWFLPSGTASGSSPVVTLSEGAHILGLRVFDSRGFQSSTTRGVTVMQDTTPPTLIAPPALTITTCTNVALGTPTATDECGPVTVSNDAPLKFPLGQRLVTWTARDQAGNTTTRTQLVTANLGDDTSCCPSGTNIVTGTSNNNTLNGTSGDDCILGRGGQDTINGNGGADAISGGDGNDVLNGGDGNDRLYGGSGQDILQGGNNSDFVDGGDGDDECRGGSGNDEVRGGAHQDRLFGEAGNDGLFGDDGDDRLEGGDGDDALNGGGLHDTCIGGAGSNTFVLCESQQPPPGGGPLTALFVVTNDWGGGYCVDLRVTNPTANLATSWNVTFNTNGAQIYTQWNGSLSGTTGTVTATPSFPWNQTIDPAETEGSVGFCANRPSGTALPSVTSILATF